MQNNDTTETETFMAFPASAASQIAASADSQAARRAPPKMTPEVAARVAQINGKRPDVVPPTHSKIKGATVVSSPVVAQAPVAPPVSAPAIITGSVPNPAPGFSGPMSDGEAISLDLPSRFAFYDFKDLYARPLRIRQMAKFNKAHEDQSMLPMVEGVSATLTSSCGRPNLGFQLCVADFYFVLYWLRFNSFSKTSLNHKTYCLNPAHIQRVKNSEWDNSTLEISTLVDRTELTVTPLEELPDPEHFKLLDQNWILRPATMMDTIAYLENPNWLDSEFQYMAKLASNIELAPGIPWKDPTRRPSLEEKIELIESWAPTQAALISEYETLLSGFGVKESTTVTCKWCGASRDSEIILDAHSFLSAE